jgi:UDP-N-acetylglucosamine 2-epimerase (non-hydrolysing)
VVLTDSGGVQEEAPSLGKPVLVMRENTERPEAVDAGTVLLIGTEEDRIVAEVTLLLQDEDHIAKVNAVLTSGGESHWAPRCSTVMLGRGGSTPWPVHTVPG